MKLKNYVNEEDLLFEEIIIGRIEGGYKISIYTEPLRNPSFHFKNKTGDTEYVFQIKDFKVLEKKGNNNFSSKELKKLEDWLNLQNERKVFKGKTNLEAIRYAWEIINE